jgi:hypothetical protein
VPPDLRLRKQDERRDRRPCPATAHAAMAMVHRSRRAVGAPLHGTALAFSRDHSCSTGSRAQSLPLWRGAKTSQRGLATRHSRCSNNRKERGD